MLQVRSSMLIIATCGHLLAQAIALGGGKALLVGIVVVALLTPPHTDRDESGKPPITCQDVLNGRRVLQGFDEVNFNIQQLLSRYYPPLCGTWMAFIRTVLRGSGD